MLIIYYGKEANSMNVTLTTKDIILACTPFVLVLGYFILNLTSYISAKKQKEADPENISDEFVRVNRVLLGVAIGALITVMVLYVLVYVLIKMNVFS